MNKKELIESLKDFDEEDEVFLAFSAGDYWHSFLVRQINFVAKLPIQFSPYFESNIISKPIDPDEVEEFESAIILYNCDQSKL